MHKHIFPLNSFFPYLIQYIVGYNRNKTRPGDDEFNFKKVGSIPYGFNTIGTTIHIGILNKV